MVQMFFVHIKVENIAESEQFFDKIKWNTNRFDWSIANVICFVEFELLTICQFD